MRIDCGCEYADRLQDRRLFVDDGISDGKWFATFYRKPNGSLKRFVSPYLPERATRAQAQTDLDAYARERDLKPY
jgi:hypothetical protein